MMYNKIVLFFRSFVEQYKLLRKGERLFPWRSLIIVLLAIVTVITVSSSACAWFRGHHQRRQESIEFEERREALRNCAALNDSNHVDVNRAEGFIQRYPASSPYVLLMHLELAAFRCRVANAVYHNQLLPGMSPIPASKRENASTLSSLSEYGYKKLLASGEVKDELLRSVIALRGIAVESQRAYAKQGRGELDVCQHDTPKERAKAYLAQVTAPQLRGEALQAWGDLLFYHENEVDEALEVYQTALECALLDEVRAEILQKIEAILAYRTTGKNR